MGFSLSEHIGDFRGQSITLEVMRPRYSGKGSLMGVPQRQQNLPEFVIEQMRAEGLIKARGSKPAEESAQEE